MNGEHKITSGHRGRLAIVYLRQSSMAQVRQHTESTMRQYGLAEEAVRLGWADGDIMVIDTDLGVSGRWGVAREGFTELVRRVCTGEVGAIFGIEISRLARSNAEVARLTEFAKITGTLLIDADGVYDPADVNDRMLLGLKSTMGEVELHVMAGRLLEAKRAAAARGDLRTPLPVGFVHDDLGDIMIDPDEQVQAAIRDVLSGFSSCGSAYGVVALFAGRRFPLRAYGGAWAGRLRWGRLTHARVVGILKNPCYAGAYVHGRYASRRTLDPDGTVHTATWERPRDQWPVLLKDHHEGYISWADFLANEAKLAANRTNAGARPPREGCALCQGIIMCGSCGKPMRTNYHTDQRPSYECSSRADRLTTPTCRSVAASYVDDAVAAALLAALTPEQVALALSAADQVTDRHARLSRATELAVERARYEADRAERAYHECEPENRLVARTLESRWEDKLTALAEAEAALRTATEALPVLPTRADLEQLATDLPALWDAPTTSGKDRKRLVRTLICDVTLLPEPDRGKVRIGIRWHTGAADELTVARPVHPGTARRSSPAAVELVRRLGPTTGNADLAAALNAAGLHTGDGRPFDIDAVQWIRHVHKIRTPSPYADGEISVGDVAGKLGCSTGAVYDWIKKGFLCARRGGGNRFCIAWDERVEADCRILIEQSAHLNPDPAARRRKNPAPASATITSADSEISVTEAATRLGCSIGVVYYWIESGHLGARRGPGNRLHIGWNTQVETACRTRIDQSGHLNPQARRSRPRQRR
ncbi:recombinase family protein [Acrocarpospora corrugata]|uniref:recombinase family protein n=1 Tax=Acrocarpospora corrugata TaxID=35763 RepID=UPI0012D31F36|nr:recombinase family protein [Acrocarpospora corrugata]